MGKETSRSPHSRAASALNEDFLAHWQNAESWVRVGRVANAHGLRGEVWIQIFAEEADWLPQLHEFYLIQSPQAQAVPQVLGLRKATWHKGGLRCSFAGLNDRNQAEALRGSLLCIPKQLLVSQPGERIYLHEVLNFTVHDGTRGEVGRVVNFSSNGAQDLLVIQSLSGEWEVPFVPQFVERIDYQQGRLYMNIPQGLLEELP